jgi:hypothetical protein
MRIISAILEAQVITIQSGKLITIKYPRKTELTRVRRSGTIIVVMPAFNAGKTLEQTYREIPFDVVDEVLLVDDASQDDTLKVAQRLGVKSFLHKRTKGYGGQSKDLLF